MITLQEATSRQEALQKDGHALLKDLNIMPLMDKLGDVHIDGSFDYGLMVKPDIDLHIYSDKPDIKKVAAICQSFFAIPELVRLVVSNRQDHLISTPGLPRGIYLSLLFDYRNQNWNFDIWILQPENRMDPESFPLDWHKKLTPEQRDNILLLKYNLSDQGRYPGTGDGMYASADIYRAVMKDNVRSIEELDEWRLDNPFY